MCCGVTPRPSEWALFPPTSFLRYLHFNLKNRALFDLSAEDHFMMAVMSAFEKLPLEIRRKVYDELLKVCKAESSSASITPLTYPLYCAPSWRTVSPHRATDARGYAEFTLIGRQSPAVS